LRLAAAEAASGSCEGVVIAESACVTLLDTVDTLCRVQGATVLTQGSAAQGAPGASDGALFNRAEPVRLHPEILAARRFCAGLLTAARARGGGAPAPSTACGEEPDDNADDLGVVETGTGPVTLGAARERAVACLRVDATPVGVVRTAVAQDGGPPSAPAASVTEVSLPTAPPAAGASARPWWRPSSVELSFGGAIPVDADTRSQVTRGVWLARVGVGFRWGIADIGVQGLFVGGGGETLYFGYDRDLTVIGGGMLVRAALAHAWGRFEAGVGVELGWVHLKRVVSSESFSEQREGDTALAGLFARPEYTVWRGSSGASFRVFVELGAAYVPLGWQDNGVVENLHARFAGGLRHAF
jgi:hypothetical protein